MDSKSSVLSLLDEDLQAADFQWSLFVAALNSYRYDSVLRPFPSAYVDRGLDAKNIEELRRVSDCIPALSELLRPVGGQSVSLPADSWNLIHWVLTSGSFSLISRSRNEYLKLIGASGSSDTPPTMPDHIFEVVPSPQADRRFQEARQNFDILYAYHGSRLDNFFSILHNGLLAHMNKNSLFGTGTYLSSELSVSITFSPAGYGWRLSCLSPEMSCVAVCEMADHPDVKCQNRTRNPSRAYASDTLAGKIPERYYLVQNNAIVRVKYLLVYTSSSSVPVEPVRSVSDLSRIVRKRETQGFLQENKFWLAILAYGLLLCGIGVSTSRVAKQFFNRLFF